MYIILSVGITIFPAQHEKENYYIDAFSFPVTMNGMSLYYSFHILNVQACIIG
jgi:heptaprenylglyceryl phosphate synthase